MKEEVSLLMDTTPYLQAELELTILKIRAPSRVEIMCDAIIKDDFGTGAPPSARWNQAQVFRQNNERLIITADILQSLVTDSSVKHVTALAELSEREQQSWERIDFTKMGTDIGRYEKPFVDMIVKRIVESRLRQARALAANGA